MPNEHKDSLIQSIQTVMLVIIESFLTLILRFDNKLRQSAYPLASDGIVLAVRSYLPHDEIYVTFSFKGLLIDSELPPHKQSADVTINAHSFEIINAIISNKPHAVTKLQFRGEEAQIQLVKNFLVDLSINQLLTNTLSRVLNKKSTNTNQNRDPKSNKDIPQNKTKDYKQKISDLRELKNELEIITAKKSIEIFELKSRQKFYTILSIVTLLVGLLSGYVIGLLV